MELKLKDMSYGLLLSHTFPGLLFGLEIALAFHLFTNFSIYKFLFSLQKFDFAVLTTVLIGVFVTATLLEFRGRHT